MPNLVRLGHYFVPNGTDRPDPLSPIPHGVCQTALVVGRSEEPFPDDFVNLAVWAEDGENFVRLKVPVSHPTSSDVEGASFHLAMECPWQR